MIAIKIKATKELLDNIIEAYNKEYKESHYSHGCKAFSS